MASQYVYDYIAGMSIKKGEVFTSDAIIALYPTAEVVQLKSISAKISINGTDAVTWYKDDNNYISAGKTWQFASDCELAIAKIINLATI